MNRFWFRSEGRNDMKIPLLSYWYISYRIYKRAWMSGYGRYSKEDLFEITCKNLNALNVLIGKKKYLFSDTQPSIADFSIFGVCTQIKFSDSGPLNKYLNSNFLICTTKRSFSIFYLNSKVSQYLETH